MLSRSSTEVQLRGLHAVRRCNLTAINRGRLSRAVLVQSRSVMPLFHYTKTIARSTLFHEGDAE